jgi:hypothetical protein
VDLHLGPLPNDLIETLHGLIGCRTRPVDAGAAGRAVFPPNRRHRFQLRLDAVEVAAEARLSAKVRMF